MIWYEVRPHRAIAGVESNVDLSMETSIWGPHKNHDGNDENADNDDIGGNAVNNFHDVKLTTMMVRFMVRLWGCMCGWPGSNSAARAG